MHRRLPVTLIGGFLGAGKTSLLHHFVTENPGGYLALLVENPGTLNLDAKALRGLCGAMRRSYDTVREIPPGGGEDQVEWIAAQLQELSQAGRYDRVLIEIAGTASLASVARHFGLLPGQPETFAPWADLHQVICVVDALDFYRTVVAPPAGQVRLFDSQWDQIKSASLIVLNKCDLVKDAEREACLRHLLELNLNAQITETAYGEVPPEIISRRAVPEELGLSAEPKGYTDVNISEWKQPILGSALYCAYRPFHPQRFWDWYNAELPGLLRVKGLIWLATRSLLVGGVSRTRWQNGCGPAGFWWAALPREEWPQDTATLMQMQETWQEPYGDRRQELVLIGDEAQLSDTTRQQLDACLLTDEEYAWPLQDWKALPDPFPEWDLSDS